MPTLARVDGMRVEIYPNDHDPPHFHVVAAEHRFSFFIADLTLREGRPPKRLEKRVREWAMPRRRDLAWCWVLIRSGHEIERLDGEGRNGGFA